MIKVYGLEGKHFQVFANILMETGKKAYTHLEIILTAEGIKDLIYL